MRGNVMLDYEEDVLDNAYEDYDDEADDAFEM